MVLLRLLTGTIVAVAIVPVKKLERSLLEQTLAPAENLGNRRLSGEAVKLPDAANGRFVR